MRNLFILSFFHPIDARLKLTDRQIQDIYRLSSIEVIFLLKILILRFALEKAFSIFLFYMVSEMFLDAFIEPFLLP